MKLLITAIACLISVSVFGQVNLADMPSCLYRLDENWSMVWVDGELPSVEREFRTFSTFPKSTIELMWKKGFHISEIKNYYPTLGHLYSDIWGVSFYEAREGVKQKYVTVHKNQVANKIKSLANEGWAIRGITHYNFDEESALIVYETGPGAVWSCSESELREAIKYLNKEGFSIFRIIQMGTKKNEKFLGDPLDVYHLILSGGGSVDANFIGDAESQELAASEGYTITSMFPTFQRFSYYPYLSRTWNFLYTRFSDKEINILITSSDKNDISKSPFQQKAESPNSSGQGSCVLVSVNPHIIATNYHVVENKTSFLVIIDNKEVNAEILEVDKNNDLALLVLDDGFDDIQAIQLCTSSSIGQRVYSIGFPMYNMNGGEVTITEGLISSSSFLGDRTKFQISCPITSGSSGGALITEEGCLVGITQGGYRPDDNTENVNAAVKYQYLSLLLQEIDVSSKNIDLSHCTKSVFAIKGQ